MTEKQKTAYDWAKAHPDYRSIAAVHARELAGLVDELMEELRGPEVVRCGECEHGKPCGLDVACYHPECDLCGGVASHEPEFFCAYGERKDGAE